MSRMSVVRPGNNPGSPSFLRSPMHCRFGGNFPNRAAPQLRPGRRDSYPSRRCSVNEVRSRRRSKSSAGSGAAGRYHHANWSRRGSPPPHPASPWSRKGSRVPGPSAKGSAFGSRAGSRPRTAGSSGRTPERRHNSARRHRSAKFAKRQVVLPAVVVGTSSGRRRSRSQPARQRAPRTPGRSPGSRSSIRRAAELGHSPEHIGMHDFPLTRLMHETNSTLSNVIENQKAHVKNVADIRSGKHVCLDNYLSNTMYDTMERKNYWRTYDTAPDIDLPKTVKDHTTLSRLTDMKNDHNFHLRRVRYIAPGMEYEEHHEADAHGYARELRDVRRKHFINVANRTKEQRKRKKRKPRKPQWNGLSGGFNSGSGL